MGSATKVIGGITGIAGGILGMQQANKDRGAAERALDRSDPFGPHRGQYGDMLDALMMDPSSVTKTPGYQFQFEQGATATDRSLAARGFLGSGNEASALTEYGQSFAMNSWQNQINMLGKLAGVDMQPQTAPYLAARQGASATTGESLDSIAGGLGSAATGIGKIMGAMGGFGWI